MAARIIFILFLTIPLVAKSQTYTLTGEITDLNGAPLTFASVALLNPSDSTLAHFGLTGSDGKFSINKIPEGGFILQVAFLSHRTFYKNLKFPENQGDLGTIPISPVEHTIGEVQVTGEKIPILIKKDTVEYQAGAFKTHPDAVAEDLLKKLPGVEVDKSGNVKAMGEDVKKVLVDGKEFFSTDPKIATKNLPANSINKVQVYNKKSDESELLGIDDSEYDKTINFVLKDDMKKAVFGELKAGGDFSNLYQANAKVYRFTEKHQFAALGMLNNINRPGFSFQDYLDFNGGIRNMMSGGGGIRITVGEGSSVPVDFGQAVTGKIASGAAGLNYSYEFKKDKRFNVSFLGSGTEKNLAEKSFTRNFTGAGDFIQNSDDKAAGSGRNQLFNAGWRNKSDSIKHYMLNAVLSLGKDNSDASSFSENYSDPLLVNTLGLFSGSRNRQLNTNIDGSWMRKGFGKWKMLKLSGSFRYSESLKESDWNSITSFTGDPLLYEESRYNENKGNKLEYSGTITGLRKINTKFYLEPSVTAGSTDELLDKSQGINQEPWMAIDSVSPSLEKEYRFVSPKLRFKFYLNKTRLNIGLAWQLAKQLNRFNGGDEKELAISLPLPEITWDYEYRTGHRLGLAYRTFSTVPEAAQLVPLIDNSNTFALYLGNRDLRPEYRHNLSASWLLFDQFSFTSVFANVNATYTRDKINRSISIGDNFRQTISLVNVTDDYSVSGNLHFSTPIRLLKINTRIELSENWNRGLSFVDQVMNQNTNHSQRINLSIDNRKKEKWDLRLGGAVDFTKASYSLQDKLSRTYFSYSAYSEIRYNPTKKWQFRIDGDLTRYDAQSFNELLTIPMLGAEISYYFLANNRASLMIEGGDLLNKNTGISRTSQLNYIREVHSKVLGRYVLVSFKYKLNKSGDFDSGFKIDVKRR